MNEVAEPVDELDGAIYETSSIAPSPSMSCGDTREFESHGRISSSDWRSRLCGRFFGNAAISIVSPAASIWWICDQTADGERRRWHSGRTGSQDCYGTSRLCAAWR